MKTTLRWLDQHFEEMLMAIFLCGVVVLMTLHVFFRYVMRAPLTWSEEATRYMFIWFVFIGISYGIRNNTHIRVNIIEVLCPMVIPVFSLIQDLAGALFILYLLPAAFNSMRQIAERNQTSAGLHLPMIFVYGALFMGLCISVIRIIQNFFAAFGFRQRKTERKQKEGKKYDWHYVYYLRTVFGVGNSHCIQRGLGHPVGSSDESGIYL